MLVQIIEKGIEYNEYLYLFGSRHTVEVPRVINRKFAAFSKGVIGVGETQAEAINNCLNALPCQ